MGQEVAFLVTSLMRERRHGRREWEVGKRAGGGRKDQRPLSVIADYKTPMSTRRPSEHQLLAHLAEKGRNGDNS